MHGYYQNLKAAKEGGKSAGIARKAFEDARGTKVVSSNNFLKKIEGEKMELLDNDNFEKALDAIASKNNKKP
jgi:hypothetical protein